MAKSISSIYDSNENLVPFYPDAAGFYQSKGRRPKEKIEDGLDSMREEAMALSRILAISYEQILNWFRGIATKLERHECEGAMGKRLSNCEEKDRSYLMDICHRYSLFVVGETTCSQKTSSPSSKVKSDVTAMKHVRKTNVEDGGQEAAQVTQEVIELSDEKAILPQSRVLRQYWQGYCDFWDNFVCNWIEERRGNPISPEYRSIANKFGKCVNGLDFDELPEPYYGAPMNGNKVKAVVINLNPGMSQIDEHDESLEWQKLYRLKDTYLGRGPFVRDSLIKEFSDRCKKRYSEFAKKWSCLNPKYRQQKTDLCGVKWWQGVNPSVVGGRMEWLARIYEKKLDAATSIHVGGELNPLEVFALELCPYHSKSFSFDDEKAFSADDDNMLAFIVKHVLQPALHAVVENPPLPFAVAIGKTFAILLEKIGRDDKFEIFAKLEKEWWDESEDVEDWQWPVTRDKNTREMRRVYRKYCLFVLKDKDGRLARFLVCAAPGSNGTPSEDFGRNIEKKLILSYVRDTPLTAELYEKIKPFPLRWWSHSNPKTWNNGSKAHTIKTESVEISQSQRPDDVRLLSALTTVAQSMCKDPDTHNFQLFLWQREGVKLYLRFTKLKPHITFNCWVDDKQAFADKYGERLLAFAKAQGLKGFLGKDHSVGNGLQFKPIKPIDLDNVNCNELQEWSGMIIAKLSEILK